MGFHTQFSDDDRAIALLESVAESAANQPLGYAGADGVGGFVQSNW
jgi:hypothetical protein